VANSPAKRQHGQGDLVQTSRFMGRSAGWIAAGRARQARDTRTTAAHHPPAEIAFNPENSPRK